MNKIKNLLIYESQYDTPPDLSPVMDELIIYFHQVSKVYFILYIYILKDFLCGSCILYDDDNFLINVLYTDYTICV